MFKNWWRQQEAFGKTPQQREENLRRGGYRIVTTLSPRIQRIAMQEMKQRETHRQLIRARPGGDRARHREDQGGCRQPALQPGSGGQRADTPTGESGQNDVPSNYPNTVAPLLGGGDMPGYQAGSTFKIFTLTAALDMGMPLNTRINAPGRLRSIYLSGPGDPSRCGINWCPRNASPAMTGTQTLWSGFGKSVNTFFVKLEQRVGAERAVRMAERLGLTWHTDIDRKMASPKRARGWGAFTLGVADTTPLEMANAYATLAADGRYCEAMPVNSITGPDGRKLAASQPNCTPGGRPAGGAGRGGRGPVRDGVRRGARQLWRMVHRAGRLPRGWPAGGRQDRHDRRHAGGLVRGNDPGPRRGELHRRSGQPVPRGRRRELPEAHPGGLRGVAPGP